MRTSPFRLALILGATILGLWVAFATLVVPRVIETVYNGTGLSFLGDIFMRNRIEGGVANTLEEYLHEWNDIARGLTTSMALFAVLGLAIVKALETPAFFERCIGRARPGVLGAIRMWTCGILLISTSCERLDTIAFMPAELRRPMGFLIVLDKLPIGFDRFVASGPELWAFQCATEVLLFLGMIGCWTRFVVPIAVVCAYVLNGILREFSFFWHQNLVPIYVLAVLSFTPCGDGWSLDRLRKIYKGRYVADAEQATALYGWSRYACWVPMALLYCWSGLSKLRQSGVMWVNPTNMRSYMYEESLSGKWYPVGQGLHLALAPDFVLVLLGLVSIATEAFYPVVLFSPRARRIVPLMGIAMHIGIIVFQDIVFLDLIALNLIFLDFTWLREAIARRLARHGPMKILYDGSCRYCRGTVRVLTAMDLFQRLEVVDFRQLDLEAFNRANHFTLDAGGLEREMPLLWKGQVYSGFSAYRILSGALPALWIVAPLLRLPGVRQLGTRVYAHVALRRYGHPRCDEHCAIEPRTTPPVMTVPNLTPAQRFGYVSGVAGLALVMTVVYVNRIEFFPLTGMQLFTGLNTSTVTYFRVIGDRASGERSQVRLEDAIKALRFNGRYRVALQDCFGDPSEKELCRKFLTASLAAYNETARPTERLVGFEVNKMVWDFHVAPDDPMHGRVADRYALRLGQSPAGSADVERPLAREQP